MHKRLPRSPRTRFAGSVDTTTLIWVVVAVAVLVIAGIVIGLVARRRSTAHREAQHRKAEEIREKARESEIAAQEREAEAARARADVAAATADAERAKADAARAEVEARRRQGDIAEHEADAAERRAEYEESLAKADEIDPLVSDRERTAPADHAGDEPAPAADRRYDRHDGPLIDTGEGDRTDRTDTRIDRRDPGATGA